MRIFVNGDIIVTINAAVTSHIKKANKKARSRHEIGGQLFGNKDNIEVLSATGPHSTDIIKTFGFTPNRSNEQLDIHKKYVDGEDFLGDWHTHLEMNPTPSALDEKSIKECYRKSTHSHKWFLLLIASSFKEENLWVGVTDGKRLIRLEEKTFKAR